MSSGAESVAPPAASQRASRTSCSSAPEIRATKPSTEAAPAVPPTKK
jgi:hypothetical protein